MGSDSCERVSLCYMSVFSRVCVHKCRCMIVGRVREQAHGLVYPNMCLRNNVSHVCACFAVCVCVCVLRFDGFVCVCVCVCVFEGFHVGQGVDVSEHVW